MQSNNEKKALVPEISGFEFFALISLLWREYLPSGVNVLKKRSQGFRYY